MTAAVETSPEFESIEAFAQFLLDEERTEFCLDEVLQLAETLRRSNPRIIAELKSYGFQMTAREVPKKVRGFTSSSHDRFYGPGSSKMHGGSGYEQIAGFAGQKG
jgi:hypothetical protein